MLEIPIVRVPKWRRVYLVCEDCHARSRGPKRKAKALVSALKKSVGVERPRPRVMTTGCLGLCPKRATAIAVVGGDDARLVVIESQAQIEWLVRPVVGEQVPTASVGDAV